MPLILGTNSIKDTGYDVANSLRFNSGSSDSLSKAFSSHGTRTKWTWSIWFKRSKLSGSNVLSACYFNDSNEDRLEIDSNGQIIWYSYQSDSYVGRLKTDRKFRDISAWYHLVLRWDTGDSTADNRMKIWINGVEETSFAIRNNPSSDAESLFNYGNGSQQWVIGHTANVNHWGGYMAEIVFCDNQKLEQTSFGEYDEDSPTIWKPIDVSGLTFGTNGFHLDFENASSLGADVSGNSNNFTVNNLTSVDQSTDTCTNNFATMNSLDNYYGAKTFSEGNLQQADPSGNSFSSHTTIGVSSGKWYAEAKLTAQGSNQTFIGVSSNQSTATDFHLGKGATSYGLYSSNGKIYNNSDSGTTYGDSYTVNDILGIYLDLDNNKLYFAKNGTIMNSGTGHSITAPASTELGFYFFSGMQWDNSQGCTWQFNFGSPIFSISSGNTDPNGYGNFEYDPSSGTFDGGSKSFYALNTKNLAEFG